MSMTFSELYQIFFGICARYPDAQVIAMHCHDWEMLERALLRDNCEAYGLLEGTITTFSGMTFPVYLVGNIIDSYMALKDEYLDNSVAIVHITIEGDFVEKKEVILGCDNQQDDCHA